MSNSPKITKSKLTIKLGTFLSFTGRNKFPKFPTSPKIRKAKWTIKLRTFFPFAEEIITI